MWLDKNPFVWLAGRDRQPATLGWLVVGGIALVWMLFWAAWPARWPSVQNFFLTAALLNAVLAWFTRQTAAQEIGQGRRDGSYELLLTTPLSPEDIVRGALIAVRRQFRALVSFVMFLNALIMLGGLAMRRWNAGALGEYFGIWLFLLTWTWSLGRQRSRLLPVMWASLNCGRPAHAVWRAYGSNTWASWIWLPFCLQFYVRQFQKFPTGSPGEITILFLLVLVWLAWFVSRSFGRAARVRGMWWDPQAKVWVKDADGVFGTRLVREFREIVREPLPDPGDPRFKKWDARERFPWGWGLAQQQLHERVARELSKPL